MIYLKRIINNRLTQHLTFWMLSFYFISSFFSVSNELKAIDLIYSLFFHLPLLFIVYANLYWLIPLLQKEKYLISLILTTLLVLMTFGLHEAIFEYLIPILPINYYIVSFTDPVDLFTIFIIYLVITTLLKFSKSWFYLKQIENENIHYELENLKAQINPHFLLNSLNSIYGLSLNNSQKTSEAVLKLSELLKHTLYGVSKRFIPLEEEVVNLNNYIELQKLRLTKPSKVKFEIKGNAKEKYVAPLIIMTLVENSFKHGNNGQNDDFYDFKIVIDKKDIEFKAKNSSRRNGQNFTKGLGLNNVQRRLELTYGKNYKLTFEQLSGTFEVRLILKVVHNDIDLT